MSEPKPAPRSERAFLPQIRKGGESPLEEAPTVTPTPGQTPVPLPTPTDPPTPPPGQPQRVAIDPITRIEGHLRIEAQIENGQVTDAWSAGMMFRGIELLLPGRDPRDAWVYAQRICGV